MLSSAAGLCARSLLGDDFAKENVADVHGVLTTCLPLQKYVRRTAGKQWCTSSSSRIEIDIRFRGFQLVR